MDPDRDTGRRALAGYALSQRLVRNVVLSVKNNYTVHKLSRSAYEDF